MLGGFCQQLCHCFAFPLSAIVNAWLFISLLDLVGFLCAIVKRFLFLFKSLTKLNCDTFIYCTALYTVFFNTFQFFIL